MQHTPPHEGRLLTQQEAADYLQVPSRTLESWRHRRTGPAYVRVGRHVRYQRSDVDAWIDKNRDAAVQ
ncbi:MAG: helix-turn-helix transcriptional regulator [Microthrixaceae bacterium]